MIPSMTSCLLRITPKTLSAYHNGALSALENTHLHDHLASCSACQMTLATFDQIAHSLNMQRIPTPDARLWRGVQALKSAPSPVAWLRLPAFWGGLGTLVTVVILLLLFVQVLGHLHATTIGASPTAIPSILSPAQAWGNYPSEKITLPLANARSFIPTDIFPDGSKVVGEASSAHDQQQVVLMDIRTQAVSVLYTATPNLVTPFAVQTDGRFVVWAGGNVGEGAHSGHNILGYDDLQTGKIVILAENTSPYQAPPVLLALTHGVVIWESPAAVNASVARGFTFKATDLASITTTILPMTSGFWNFVTANWPYLLWNTTSKDATASAIWYRENFTTGQLTQVPGFAVLNENADGAGVALDGSSLFWLRRTRGSEQQSIQLSEIDQIDQSGIVSRPLGPVVSATTVNQLGVNTRLVAWVGQTRVANTLYAWDRTQNHLITFEAQRYQNPPQLVMHDQVLLIIQNFGNGHGAIEIIDTARLPTTMP